MHINLESDYAVRIVRCLAQSGEKQDAQTLADKACVSLRFTLKIMRKLVAAGLVKSYKGRAGRLCSRPPGGGDHAAAGDRSGRRPLSVQPLRGRGVCLQLSAGGRLSLSCRV